VKAAGLNDDSAKVASSLESGNFLDASHLASD
jgi:hypothetical protein